MFTTISFVLMAVAAWLANRGSEKDRKLYDVPPEGALVLHIRQDLKLIAFLLAGILVMLGILADIRH
jgi:hypothetical protein